MSPARPSLITLHYCRTRIACTHQPFVPASRPKKRPAAIDLHKHEQDTRGFWGVPICASISIFFPRLPKPRHYLLSHGRGGQGPGPRRRRRRDVARALAAWPPAPVPAARPGRAPRPPVWGRTRRSRAAAPTAGAAAPAAAPHMLALRIAKPALVLLLLLMAPFFPGPGITFHLGIGPSTLCLTTCAAL
jgi:hypothetical protein